MVSHNSMLLSALSACETKHFLSAVKVIQVLNRFQARPPFHDLFIHQN